MSTLDITFAAVMQQSPAKGGWPYVTMAGSADLRKRLHKAAGDTVTVHLTERIDR